MTNVTQAPIPTSAQAESPGMHDLWLRRLDLIAGGLVVLILLLFAIRTWSTPPRRVPRPEPPRSPFATTQESIAMALTHCGWSARDEVEDAAEHIVQDMERDGFWTTANALLPSPQILDANGSSPPGEGAIVALLAHTAARGPLDPEGQAALRLALARWQTQPGTARALRDVTLWLDGLHPGWRTGEAGNRWRQLLAQRSREDPAGAHLLLTFQAEPGVTTLPTSTSLDGMTPSQSSPSDSITTPNQDAPAALPPGTANSDGVTDSADSGVTM